MAELTYDHVYGALRSCRGEVEFWPDDIGKLAEALVPVLNKHIASDSRPRLCTLCMLDGKEVAATSTSAEAPAWAYCDAHRSYDAIPIAPRVEAGTSELEGGGLDRGTLARMLCVAAMSTMASSLPVDELCAVLRGGELDEQAYTLADTVAFQFGVALTTRTPGEEKP